MSKKVTYSKPLHNMWKMYKQWCKVNKSKDGELFYKQLHQHAYTVPDAICRQAMLREASFWYNDYRKEILHVWFEDKELFNFLQDNPLKDIHGIKTYLKDNGKPDEMPVPKTNKPYKWIKYLIAIHIPNVITSYTFGFSLDVQCNEISLYMCSDDGVMQIHETGYEKVVERTDWEAEKIKKNFRFAVNLLAYMECFPECVHEGVPSINNDNLNRYKDCSVLLGISEKITETVKGTMRPHFRKGYFKRLSSPFYKNKRGELIWVSETSVNTKSKTVSLSDSQEKLQNFKSSHE